MNEQEELVTVIKYLVVHLSVFPEKEATKSLTKIVIAGLTSFIYDDGSIKEILTEFTNELSNIYYHKCGAAYSRGKLRDGYIEFGLNIPEELMDFDGGIAEKQHFTIDVSDKKPNKYTQYTDEAYKIIIAKRALTLKQLIKFLDLDPTSESTTDGIRDILNVLVDTGKLKRVEYKQGSVTTHIFHDITVFPDADINKIKEATYVNNKELESDNRIPSKGIITCIESIITSPELDTTSLKTEEIDQAIVRQYNRKYKRDKLEYALKYLEKLHIVERQQIGNSLEYDVVWTYKLQDIEQSRKKGHLEKLLTDLFTNNSEKEFKEKNIREVIGYSKAGPHLYTVLQKLSDKKVIEIYKDKHTNIYRLRKQ